MTLSRRYVSIVSILGLSALVLAEFQNCAPASPRISTPSDARGGVKVIEDLNPAQIQFVAPVLEVRDTAPAADLEGICNTVHDGAKLNWQMNGAVSGETSCAGGQFDIHVEGLDQIPCGEVNRVLVKADWGDSAKLQMIRKCQPLATQAIATPLGMPPGTECELEYDVSPDAHSPCLQVCFRADIVMSQIPVDLSQCAGLASQLSGTSRATGQ